MIDKSSLRKAAGPEVASQRTDDVHEPETNTDRHLDLVWGAELIAAELNITKRTAFYLLEHGAIPAQKIGRRWCTTRGALRKRFGVS